VTPATPVSFVSVGLGSITDAGRKHPPGFHVPDVRTGLQVYQRGHALQLQHFVIGEQFRVAAHVRVGRAGLIPMPLYQGRVGQQVGHPGRGGQESRFLRPGGLSILLQQHKLPAPPPARVIHVGILPQDQRTNGPQVPFVAAIRFLRYHRAPAGRHHGQAPRRDAPAFTATVDQGVAQGDRAVGHADFQNLLQTGNAIRMLNQPEHTPAPGPWHGFVVGGIGPGAVFGRHPEPVAAINGPGLSAGPAQLVRKLLEQVGSAGDGATDDAGPDIRGHHEFGFSIRELQALDPAPVADLLQGRFHAELLCFV